MTRRKLLKAVRMIKRVILGMMDVFALFILMFSMSAMDSDNLTPPFIMMALSGIWLLGRAIHHDWQIWQSEI